MRRTASTKSDQNSRNSTISTCEQLEDREMMAADVDFTGAAPEPLSSQVIHLPTQTAVSTNNNVTLHDTYGLTGLGQTVVVIDGGVAYDHFALGGGFGDEHRVVGGWDFAEDDGDPYDDAPGGLHGTHTAGIIASSDSTHTGVAPEVDIVALRVFDDNASGDFTWIESALDWVHDHKDDFENPITTVSLSVGTAWNSDSVPAWAQLEEEFQALEEDGIFISVAAGNGFRSSQTVGLSYPAVSPHVVPVGSVNAAGNMSAFSQRNERILVAPGELITSTAPDYISGFDGVTDDFASSSGTSMSAPYVAGASILVRQALEIAGHTDITQDVIYEHLRETADDVYDSVTDQTYLRVNLDRALESALPADLVGGTLATAKNLGDVGDVGTVAGWMNSAVDTDVFSFEASQSGSVRIITEGAASGLDVQRVGGDESGYDFTFEVVAGSEYALQIDAGTMPGEFQTRFEFTADQVVTSPTTNPETKPTTNPETNPFVDLNGATHIATTDNVDHIEIWAGAKTELAINGERRVLTSEQAQNIVIDGADAADFVTIHGTAGAENVTVREDHTTVQGSGWSVNVHGAKRLDVNGGGGEDAVVVHDGAGDDLVIGRKEFTILLGAEGRNHRVSGFDDVQVVANAGGRDVAILHDGTGDDFFRFSYESSTMQYDEGTPGAPSIEVVSFERAVGRSLQGGTDRAEAHGGSDAYRFVARANASYLTGFRESHRAEGFDHVDAYGAEGNTAWIYDTAGDDHLTLTPDSAEIRGGYSATAHDYDEVGALGDGGGTDTVVIRDSQGDDTFISMDGLAIMDGDGFRQVVQGYERVTAVSMFGDDRAVLYGSNKFQDKLAVNGVVHQVTNPTRDHSAMRFGQVDLKGTLTPSTEGPRQASVADTWGTGVMVAAADPALAIQPRQLSSDRVDEAVVRGDGALSVAPDGDSELELSDLIQHPVATRDLALEQPIERQVAAVDEIVRSEDQDADEIAAAWETYGDETHH